MSGRWSGIAAGGAAAGAGALAHVAAGGAVGPAFVVAATASMTVGGLLGPRLRWTFWRAVAAAAAVQPLVHLALASGGGHAHAGHHADHTVEGRMWILHTAVAVVVAVLVRWGGRWRRTMPAAIRAVAVAVAPAGPPPVVPDAPHWALTDGGAAPRAVATLAWTSRGPPSST